MGWAARLGLFLFARILRDGEDKRFVRAKQQPSVFFTFWTIQGVWVFVTLLPTSASRSSEAQPQPQQQGPPRLCSDAATYPMYLIIRTQSSRFNSTRTIDIYGRGVLSVKNINLA